MRAVICTARGGPEHLGLSELSDPVPEAGQVGMRVLAAGVNYADVAMRQGLYPGSPEPPFVPGFEVCGTVEAAGEGAAFGIVFLTAYGCLRLQGGVKAGDTALIHAAGGGVGTAAVQLAKAWGARVIATAGSDE
jgi:NADPH2:quinone reductase